MTEPFAVQQVGDPRNRTEQRTQPAHVEITEWPRPAVLRAQDPKQQPTDHLGTSLSSIYAASRPPDALNALQSPHSAFWALLPAITLALKWTYQRARPRCR